MDTFLVDMYLRHIRSYGGSQRNRQSRPHQKAATPPISTRRASQLALHRKIISVRKQRGKIQFYNSFVASKEKSPVPTPEPENT